jgi:tRNA dimethylallyltransferase
LSETLSETSIPVVVIVGPTAVGKSDLAVTVAEALDGEIVSADAMQLYRGLDIGTAKVDAATRERVPHHCLDLIAPDERASAGDFARLASAAIEGIRERGNLPIVVGGSGFYLRALLEGLAPLPARDTAWRKALEALEARRGLRHLYAMLLALDPVWAEQVGESDRQRILRGIEVTLRRGEPMSSILAREGWKHPGYDAIWVGLRCPREMLRKRIAERVDAMLAAGWVEEVRDLLAAGVSPDAAALRAIGYRELAACVAGESCLLEAREAIVRATGQYAKRQMTWFRRQTLAEWFEIASAGEAEREALGARVLAFVQSRLDERGRQVEDDW